MRRRLSASNLIARLWASRLPLVPWGLAAVMAGLALLLWPGPALLIVGLAVATVVACAGLSWTDGDRSRAAPRSARSVADAHGYRVAWRQSNLPSHRLSWRPAPATVLVEYPAGRRRPAARIPYPTSTG
jgi:hypothetical protein